jgi:hypothetical protein
MPCYLKVDAKFKKPVGIKENPDDQNAQRFKKVKRVPENVCIRIF